MIHNNVLLHTFYTVIMCQIFSYCNLFQCLRIPGKNRKLVAMAQVSIISRQVDLPQASKLL